MGKLTAEYPQLEERHRAAIVAESAEAEQRAADDPPGDPEQRERTELRRRSRLAALSWSAPHSRRRRATTARRPSYRPRPGAAGRYRLSYSRTERRAAPEQRAVTPAPSTTDENLAPIVPAIFDRIRGGVARYRDADGRHRRRGVSGAVHVRDRRAEGEKRRGGRDRGRVHGDDGAAPAHYR